MERNFKHNLHFTEGNTVSEPQSPISLPLIFSWVSLESLQSDYICPNGSKREDGPVV